MPKNQTRKATDDTDGTYVERPLAKALADPDDIAAVEDRQPDQIEDYHKVNPTLQADTETQDA